MTYHRISIGVSHQILMQKKTCFQAGHSLWLIKHLLIVDSNDSVWSLTIDIVANSEVSLTSHDWRDLCFVAGDKPLTVHA